MLLWVKAHTQMESGSNLGVNIGVFLRFSMLVNLHRGLEPTEGLLCCSDRKPADFSAKMLNRENLVSYQI